LKTRIFEGLWGGSGGAMSVGAAAAAGAGGDEGETLEVHMNRMWRDIKMALP
jgi:hypothetical protein